MVAAPPAAKPRSSFLPFHPSFLPPLSFFSFLPSLLPSFHGAGRCNFSHFLLYCIGQMRWHGGRRCSAVLLLLRCGVILHHLQARGCGRGWSPSRSVLVLRPATIPYPDRQTDTQTDRQTDSRDPSTYLFFPPPSADSTPSVCRAVGP